ncbi:MAG: hypothetical protein HDT47_00965 [Ruminococcaceae bacterium]|nr:hypothetical protein [Oscillospiraceae bacterium]
MFVIPEALRDEGHTYSMIRVHNGETAILADPDSDIDTVTIETDKFGYNLKWFKAFIYRQML